jgi:hypothetical protein
MIIVLKFLKEGMRGCFCLCVRKVKNAKKQTDKFQEGLLPSCEVSKECKETDKQILEEGRCCPMRKSKECIKTTDKFQRRLVAIGGRKEKKYLGSARHQRRCTWDSCLDLRHI